MKDADWQPNAWRQPMTGLLQNAAAMAVVPLLSLIAGSGLAQTSTAPLAEPLTRDELKPTYFAIVECARRNQEPGCRAARELADELMDRPFVTALCKDTAYEVTQQAKTAETNSFERKDELVRLARDTMDLCKGKEDPIPVYGELDGNQPDDNKINILDLLN